MKVSLLSNNVPWFGKYSGYERLGNYFPSGTKVSVTYSPDSKLIRALGKTANMLYSGKLGNIRNDGTWAVFRFLLKNGINDVSHILYADGNIQVFKSFKDENLVGTIHFPMSRWNKENLNNLQYFKNGIILYKEEISDFNKHIDSGGLTFIRHGVDTDFFQPGPLNQVDSKKVLFVGSFLRNFDMFLKVYELISKEIADDYQYHFLIPKLQRNYPALVKLSQFKNVFFHEKLTDEEMLHYYQTSHVLLMPMDDSGANTAIIQAISTGLPVLTTDVGGIRSYGGGDVYPVIKNNDVVSMVELFHKYSSDINYRNDIATAQRNFALEHMEWHKIAEQHIQFYNKALNI